MKNKNGFLQNKNVITIIASVIIVAVLIIGYNIRVYSAVSMETVPYARDTIPAKTEITEGMLDKVRIPRSALVGNIVTSVDQVVDPNGKIKYYTRVNTVIPKGSLIYRDAIVVQDNLPDASLYKLEKGEKLNYITVNMLSSFSNSIKPGQYIDIYASVQFDHKTQVAKLFENIRVLAVKTSSGENVFENPNVKRVPYVIFFGLKDEEDMLLKQIHAINNWGGAQTEEGIINTTSFVLTPVPTAVSDVELSEKLAVKITSTKMKEEINQISEDVTAPEYKYDSGNVVQSDK